MLHPWIKAQEKIWSEHLIIPMDTGCKPQSETEIGRSENNLLEDHVGMKSLSFVSLLPLLSNPLLHTGLEVNLQTLSVYFCSSDHFPPCISLQHKQKM